MTIIVGISYQQANSSLTREALNKLKQSSYLNQRFIENWFYYRQVDLQAQIRITHSVEFLSQLINKFKNSNKKLNQFVQSGDWYNLVDQHQKDFILLSRLYDYIDDIYLIDTQGNILFSVDRLSDLGANLTQKPLVSSEFRSSYISSLKNNSINFSDMEFYQPNKNNLASFLTRPIKNNEGKILGVFAVRFQIENVINQLNTDSKTSSQASYIIGEDGYLRSPIQSKKEQILRKKIDTQQYHLWKNEHSDKLVLTQKEQILEYLGPNNSTVFGIHKNIELPGLTWALITEINYQEALEPATWLAKVTLLLVVMTIILVIILAILISNKITLPIIKLTKVANLVSKGQFNKKIELQEKNEFGTLAKVFNHMLSVRQQYEESLKQKTRLVETALKDLEEQKFALDQHSIVAITDVKGTITYANERFSQISGYSQEELLGQNHRLLNSSLQSDTFWKEMYKTIAQGHVWHGVVCNITKNKQYYWVDTTIVPFMGDNNKPKSYIAIRTDISPLKLIEENLTKANYLSEQATLAKSQFLASMSHELRTPMNGVLGMLELLLDTHLDNEQLLQARTAKNSATSLLTIINDILDFSKIEANKLEMEFIDFNLIELITNFSHSIALQAQTKKIELIIDVKNIKYMMVNGDPVRLRQVLSNLVSNAIKFTSKGEISLIFSVRKLGRNQLKLHCSVKDSGLGIPDNKISKLFDSFSQVDSSTTRKFGGTGLGLSIVKKLCHLMYGDITVTSKINKGSCFSFHILLDDCQQQPLITPDIKLQPFHLLVVDDNPNNANVIRNQLIKWGAQVSISESASSALNLLTDQKSNQRIDLVFIDSLMPEMDGLELAKEIHKHPKFHQLKCVLMFNIGEPRNQELYKCSGIHTAIPKPVSLMDLSKVLSLLSTNSVVPSHDTKMIQASNLQKLAWKGNTHILLVEDNKTNQMVAQQILKKMGLSSDIANDGEEALGMLNKVVSSKNADITEEKNYSLILMDCQMPRMDGYEATRQIRSGTAGTNNTSIPIIAMTANAMQGDREQCLDVGMNDYLAKPINIVHLKKILQKWIK